MYRRAFMAMTMSLPVIPAAAGASRDPVLVELFTSQGCSSCPSAEALFGELIQQPGIVGLSWHVDYWNNLGWHDPFSQREWSERQSAYARLLGDEVYTPAMVVNGVTMVVGSDRTAVNDAIARAPRSASGRLRRATSGLAVEIDGNTDGLSGLLVIYDDKCTTMVRTGENQGQRLLEHCVVREAIQVDLKNPGLISNVLPIARERKALLLIQDTRMRVVGVAEMLPDHLNQ